MFVDGRINDKLLDDLLGDLIVPSQDNDEIGFLITPAGEDGRLATFSDRGGITLARHCDTDALLSQAASLITSLVKPPEAAFGLRCRTIRSEAGITIGAAGFMARIASVERQIQRRNADLIYTLRVWVDADFRPLNIEGRIDKFAYFLDPLSPKPSELERTWMLASMAAGGSPAQVLPMLERASANIEFHPVSSTEPIDIVRSVL